MTTYLSIPIPTQAGQPITTAIGSLAYIDTGKGDNMHIWDGKDWIMLTDETLTKTPSVVCATATVSAGTFYTAEVSVVSDVWNEMYTWTRTTFGPPQRGHDASNNKWLIVGEGFWFVRQQDRDWFYIRWGTE